MCLTSGNLKYFYWAVLDFVCYSSASCIPVCQFNQPYMCAVLATDCRKDQHVHWDSKFKYWIAVINYKYKEKLPSEGAGWHSKIQNICQLHYHCLNVLQCVHIHRRECYIFGRAFALVSMLLYKRGPLWLSVVCPFSPAQRSFLCSCRLLTPLLLLLRDLLCSLLLLAPASVHSTCGSSHCPLVRQRMTGRWRCV